MILQVSPPLVSFRESVLDPSAEDESTAPLSGKIVEVFTPTGLCCIRVRAQPLSEKAASFLSDNQDALRNVLEENSGKQNKYQEFGSRFASIVESSPQRTQGFFNVCSFSSYFSSFISLHPIEVLHTTTASNMFFFFVIGIADQNGKVYSVF